MKRNEIRALTDEVYTVLDDFESEAVVERALEVVVNAPHEPESYLLMCEVALEAEKFEQALEWLDQGLFHHPRHEALLLKKASVLIDSFEEIDEAFEFLSQIKSHFGKKSPEVLKRIYGGDLVIDVYLLLTDCYRLKSDYKQALIHAKLANSISPFDQNALLAVATAHFELGDYDRAKEIIHPVDEKNEPSDFNWLLAQIYCAEGNILEADKAFHRAYKLDKARYHRPVRLKKTCFITAFEQALLALPREIRDFIRKTAVEVHEAVPLDLIKNSSGRLSPEACITIEKVSAKNNRTTKIISIFQRNIENLASRKEEIKDLIASALLHELGKLISNK